ncbi:hypothetical protein AM493_19465 [Flavobacterium akiainvivens]|uniref:Plasmid stabilization protein n=1 Tax=Flavobacterium akiainvivens TaxID=1202724 RepID=A0A0M8ML08_9FLAO|nr:type II toxin-antitoxin system RelE/ParE family toxin [Flavobacterium akiainvivens]KOS07987.1 hypothetical protein AM493_19465 [Flavobacterium akiainvivens]SFQ61613.1 Plasmid stabilization system protein ParE [Flavobacterium akiainvivens]
MKLTVSLRAKKDIRQALKWYEDKQKGLGRRFVDTIRQEFDFIKNNPDSYQIRYKNVHTAVVSVFPYLIHYALDLNKNQITILAVIHTSLNPQKWK